MVIGLLRITLHLPEARSLKDRRAVVRRAVDRVRAKFNVAVAEVGDLERWQLATVAVAVVTNDRGHANEMLDRVTGALASAAAGAAMITQREMDIQSYGDREPLGGGAFGGFALAGGRAGGARGDDDGDDGDDDDGDEQT